METTTREPATKAEKAAYIDGYTDAIHELAGEFTWGGDFQRTLDWYIRTFPKKPA